VKDQGREDREFLRKEKSSEAAIAGDLTEQARVIRYLRTFVKKTSHPDKPIHPQEIINDA
jgi:hypothetical protein